MRERLPQEQAPQTESAASRHKPAATASQPRRRWWAVWLCVLLVVAALHPALLRLAVRPLVADDAPRTADHLFVYSGDGRFGNAADAYRRGEAKTILVLDRPATRLVRLGILSSRADECRRELGRRGVPEDAIVLIPGAASTPWQTARCLGGWLREHPQQDVLVLCDRFASGDLRYAMSRVLGAEPQRVILQALADRRYDEASWWRSRTGWRAAVGAACELAYDRLRGEDRDLGPDREFDLKAFEQALR
jgi:hypothetical protein